MSSIWTVDWSCRSRSSDSDPRSSSELTCPVPRASSVSSVGASPLRRTGLAREPPADWRMSSSRRSAARAARPTSSGRLFNPSSSSTTVSGMTIAQLGYAERQFGSAIRTDVSRTTRVRCAVATSLVDPSSKRDCALTPGRSVTKPSVTEIAPMVVDLCENFS